MPKFPNTPAKRFFKIAGMSTRVASKVAKNKLQNRFSGDDADDDQKSAFYNEIGSEIFQTLGEMKGAAMKIGQIASQLSHIFPDEIAEQLAKLQKQSPPLPFEVISQQFQRELGFLPLQLFKTFDEEPFASASIGQVHRAVTHDGQELVIKVQYPGVASSCRSDLIQLKRLFRLSGLVNVDKQALDEVFDEIEDNLMKELDYVNEAHNLKRFREFHQQQGNSHIIIPEVLEDFSNEAILCLKYEPGDHVSELDAKGYSDELKNQLVLRLVSAVTQEVMLFNEAHNDPHPGNFAFRPNGDVVIYDYGSVAEIKDTVIDAYIALFDAAMVQDYVKIDTLLQELGMRSEEPFAADEAAELYQICIDDFVYPLLQQTAFNPMAAEIKENIEKHMKLFLQQRNYFKPCADTLFLNRIATGHFLNFAQMKVDVDIKPTALKHIFAET